MSDMKMDVEEPEAKVEETNAEEGTTPTLDYSKQLETNFAMVEQSVKILRAFW